MFVEGEEEFEAVAVGGEGLGAVGSVDGAVEGGVGFGEGAFELACRVRRALNQNSSRGYS